MDVGTDEVDFDGQLERGALQRGSVGRLQLSQRQAAYKAFNDSARETESVASLSCTSPSRPPSEISVDSRATTVTGVGDASLPGERLEEVRVVREV